jgi:hypothetical protein
MQHRMAGWLTAVALGLVAAGWGEMGLPPSAVAQSSPASPESRTEIPPQVLAEIREAPFSEIFSVPDGAAFGIKDQDYQASEPTIGVFSLWADVPT